MCIATPPPPGAVTAGGSKIIVTPTLTDNGTFDLFDNRLIVNYSASDPIGTWNGSAYTGITGLVATGRNGGAWNGTGIRSSLGNGLRTGLAVADASDIFASQTATWGTEVVDATAVLVRYTVDGDANLNGSLTGDDYFQIDSNFAQSGTVFGYNRGDFDFNGRFNADDYFILDSNYGNGLSFGAALPLELTEASPLQSAVVAPLAVQPSGQMSATGVGDVLVLSRDVVELPPIDRQVEQLFATDRRIEDVLPSLLT